MTYLPPLFGVEFCGAHGGLVSWFCARFYFPRLGYFLGKSLEKINQTTENVAVYHDA